MKAETAPGILDDCNTYEPWGSTSSNTIEMLGTRGQIYASGAMIKSITPSPREGIGVTGRRPGPELNPLKGDVAQLPPLLSAEEPPPFRARGGLSHRHPGYCRTFEFIDIYSYED
jgi:hypothetical protein